ncbi:MAG TPA: serine hydrolase domain-containing protein [Pseudomonadales bacterium]
MNGKVLFLVALCASQALWAQEPRQPEHAAPDPEAAPAPVIDRADLEAFVDGFVQARMQSEHVVGVTVSIVHGGETIFTRGYGYADREAGIPVRADRTLFRPGSISKTFTWTAVMQLYEQGKLDLDADIRTYLPNVEIDDTFPEPITMKHLMAHTPGFEESVLGHLFGNDPARVLGLVEYLSAYRPARVRPPGEVPSYSNYGVGLAGLIVANLSGLSWEEYAERHLFEPLGMHHSTFREPWAAEDPAPMLDHLVQDVSKGYRRFAGGYQAGTFTFISQVGPAGALSTTAADMARWMLAHLNGGELDGVRILAPETAVLMHSRHYGLDPEMPGMAHGFIESHLNGWRAIGHGGGTMYFLSDMQLLPELDLGVFISTNTAGGGGKLIDRFANALVERYFPPGPLLPGEPAAEPGRPLAEYAGTYLTTRRPYTTVERLVMTNGARVTPVPGGGLAVVAPGVETRLLPLGGDRFVAADTGTLVKFTGDGDGIDTLLLPMPVMVMQKAGVLENPNVLYAVLALAAFVMLGALIGALLRRRRPPIGTPGERWAGRITVLTALAWIVAYVAAFFGLARLATDLTAAFFGFPSTAFVTALALMLVAAVLTVIAVVLLYPVWRGGEWSLGRRLRHTAVVLAALATLLVLYDFNAIGFNYLPR